MIPVLTLLVLSGFRWAVDTGGGVTPTPTAPRKLISPEHTATLPAEVT